MSEVKNTNPIIVLTGKDWFKPTILVILILSFLTGLGIFIYDKYEEKKTQELQNKRKEIENDFLELEGLITESDTISSRVDTSKKSVQIKLQNYRELIQKNHYENDSELIFINNVHIDTLLSRLPEFSGELDSL